MSSSFVNSQLFSNNQSKELKVRNNMHLFGYYSSVLDGRMTYTEWNKLTPKEKEMVIESQEEIRVRHQLHVTRHQIYIVDALSPLLIG